MTTRHEALSNWNRLAPVVPRPEDRDLVAAGNALAQAIADLEPGGTYVDGVGGTRCKSCHATIRNGAEEPMASLRISDIEELACLLVDYVDVPTVWTDTIKRLEQAAGRSVRQMRDDMRERGR